MSKVLIIHPKDDSTTFLEKVYEPIVEKTVITGGITKEELHELIKTHEQVMMMGHGSPDGLFAMGNFGYTTFIIGHDTAKLLSEKDNSVFIWCNADTFVNEHKLKGFYTGMFISEVGEAYYCGLPGTKQEVVDESNYGFVNIISEVINESVSDIYKKVLESYGEIANTNSVALYNYNRLYLS